MKLTGYIENWYHWGVELPASLVCRGHWPGIVPGLFVMAFATRYKYLFIKSVFLLYYMSRILNKLLPSIEPVLSRF